MPRAGTSQLSRCGVGEARLPGELGADPEEHRDDHEVVEHGSPRRGEEPVPRVEEGRAEGHEPVEEDLREQEAGQRRADVAERADVDGRVGVQREHADDQGCGEHRDRSDDGEHDGRHREHCVGRSSSLSSSWAVKTGTSVAERTPPRISS